MTSAGWWTPADDAELAVLVREFTDGVYDHRRGCSVCSQGGAWCSRLQEAFDAVLEWRERRSAASFAAGMRRLQNQLDELTSSAPDCAADRKGAA
jgi:hypothetical protein